MLRKRSFGSSAGVPVTNRFTQSSGEAILANGRAGSKSTSCATPDASPNTQDTRRAPARTKEFAFIVRHSLVRNDATLARFDRSSFPLSFGASVGYNLTDPAMLCTIAGPNCTEEALC